MKPMNIGFLWVLLVSLALQLPHCPPTFAADAATQVSITADRLRLQGDRKQAIFEGNVRFSVNNAVFSCDHLVVMYDDNGAIKTATADGHVAITRNNARAVAEQATLNLKTGIVILRGHPRFTKDRNTLSGKQIQININTGEVNVTEASGTFVFPQGS